MAAHLRKVEEAEAAVMELSMTQAKATLMLLAREVPKEVLEVIRDEL